MFELLRGLTNLIKCKRLHIDCQIFRLHYIFTVAILLAFGMIISSKQYVGEPIYCESHGISPSYLINSFCFIHSTFIVQKLGQSPSWHGHEPNKTNHKYQTYYQWVCFVIFIQAILFYIPHWIWKSWESGRIRLLVSDLNDGMSLDSNRRKGQVNLNQICISCCCDAETRKGSNSNDLLEHPLFEGGLCRLCFDNIKVTMYAPGDDNKNVRVKIIEI